MKLSISQFSNGMLLDINIAKYYLNVLLKKDLQHFFFDKIIVVVVTNIMGSVSLSLQQIFCPPGTEKLNKSPQADKNPW